MQTLLKQAGVHDFRKCAMKLLIQSAMIFFGTLMAAGVVALGEPAGARVAVKPATATPVVASTRAPAQEAAIAPRR
jgi:hypothetical protein